MTPDLPSTVLLRKQDAGQLTATCLPIAPGCRESPGFADRRLSRFRETFGIVRSPAPAFPTARKPGQDNNGFSLTTDTKRPVGTYILFAAAQIRQSLRETVSLRDTTWRG